MRLSQRRLLTFIALHLRVLAHSGSCCLLGLLGGLLLVDQSTLCMGIPISSVLAFWIIVGTGWTISFTVSRNSRRGGEGTLVASSQAPSTYQGANSGTRGSIGLDPGYRSSEETSSTDFGQTSLPQHFGQRNDRSVHVRSMAMCLRKYVQGISSILLILWYNVVLQPGDISALEVGNALGGSKTSISEERRLGTSGTSSFAPQEAWSSWKWSGKGSWQAEWMAEPGTGQWQRRFKREGSREYSPATSPAHAAQSSLCCSSCAAKTRYFCFGTRQEHGCLAQCC